MDVDGHYREAFSEQARINGGGTKYTKTLDASSESAAQHAFHAGTTKRSRDIRHYTL